MSERISVILGDDQAKELRDYVYAIISDSVASVKRDTGISQRWLRKNMACKYAGVSSGTFVVWTKHGLPCHIIEGVTLYDKGDIDYYINHNGIITK